MKKSLTTILTRATLFCLGLMFQLNKVYAQSDKLNDANFTFPLSVLQNPGIKGDVKGNWLRMGIDYLFQRGITIMAGTIGTAAVLMMVIGGFMILSSAGNDTQINKGKGLIKNAVIGLAAVLGAYILVTTVQLLIKSIFQ